MDRHRSTTNESPNKSKTSGARFTGESSERSFLSLELELNQASATRLIIVWNLEKGSLYYYNLRCLYLHLNYSMHVDQVVEHGPLLKTRQINNTKFILMIYSVGLIIR
jgi:hypothetical protein